MLGTTVDFELAEDGATEAIVRHHAFDCTLDEELWAALADAGGVFDFLVTDEASFGGVDLLFFFFAAEADIGCIQHDDEIARVHMRGESRLGFAAQDIGRSHGDVTEDLILGINDVPLAVRLFLGFGGKCLH